MWSLLADLPLTHQGRTKWLLTRLIKPPVYMHIRALGENYSLWRRDKILNRSENTAERAKQSMRKMYLSPALKNRRLSARPLSKFHLKIEAQENGSAEAFSD